MGIIPDFVCRVNSMIKGQTGSSKTRCNTKLRRQLQQQISQEVYTTCLFHVFSRLVGCEICTYKRRVSVQNASFAFCTPTVDKLRQVFKQVACNQPAYSIDVSDVHLSVNISVSRLELENALSNQIQT